MSGLKERYTKRQCSLDHYVNAPTAREVRKITWGDWFFEKTNI